MCLHQESVVPLAVIFWSLVLVHGDLFQQWAGMILKGKWPEVTLKISLRRYSINEFLKDYLRAQACSRSNTWYNITTSLKSIHNEREKGTSCDDENELRRTMCADHTVIYSLVTQCGQAPQLGPTGSLLEMQISGLPQTCWIKSPFSQDPQGTRMQV